MGIAFTEARAKSAIRMVVLAVAACGTPCVGAAATFTIGGVLAGLKSGESITLLDNGGNALKLTHAGSFTFTKALASGAAYNVTVSTQPAGQICSVSNAKGKVGTAKITNVAVSCVSGYSIGGTASGLITKNDVVLELNSTFSLTVSKNGSFLFTSLLADNAAYKVAIKTQPTDEVCSLADASGKVHLASIKTVKLACALRTFSIGGTVSGLSAGKSVTLLDNHKDSLTLGRNGPFTFKTLIAFGGAYDVTIGTQPSGESCALKGGSGQVALKNITTVAVTCSANSTPTYSIGGSVSGLSSEASVTLTLNGGDTTTVSSNATFTFSTQLDSGAKYNVQVKTQPTGETCAIGGGVGTVASANITNVKVTCSASSGGGGSPFWLPFAEMPDTSATGGVNAIAVLPSGNITSSPNLDTVATGSFQVIDFTYEYELNSGTATYFPQYVIYEATDKNGNQQLYNLSLVASASAPVPVQLGNIAVASTQSICRSKLVQTDLTDPTSFFVLLDIGTTDCNGLSDTYEVVHSGDSATTSPTVVSVTSTDVDILYSDAKMTGMVLYQPNSNTVDFFADDTFTNPKTLFSNIFAEEDMSVGSLRDVTTFTTESLFITIQPNSSSAWTLYRIDDSGDATSVMTLANEYVYFDGSGTGDDSNIYFFTSANANGVFTETLNQVPAGGGSPMQLFQKELASGETVSLLGSNDSNVVFQDNVPKSGNTSAAVTFYSVPVGKTSTSATPLNATAYPGTSSTVNGFMVSPSLTDLSGALVLVDITNVTVTGNTSTTQYSSIALQPGSTSSATPTANSVYGAFGTLGSAATGLAWQITSITDSNGGMGGGTLNLTDVTTLANTPLTTTGGGNYVIPAGYHSIGRAQGSLVAISSTGIAGGVLANENEKTVSSANPANKYGAIGLAIDLNAGFVLPEEVAATDVETF